MSSRSPEGADAISQGGMVNAALLRFLPRVRGHMSFPRYATRPEEPAMLTQIRGLHQVTSMASNARTNDDFFTRTLGRLILYGTGLLNQADVEAPGLAEDTHTPRRLTHRLRGRGRDPSRRSQPRHLPSEDRRVAAAVGRGSGQFDAAFLARHEPSRHDLHLGCRLHMSPTDYNALCNLAANDGLPPADQLLPGPPGGRAGGAGLCRPDCEQRMRAEPRHPSGPRLRA